MRTISADFKSRLYDDDYRDYTEDVYITLQDGTELHLTRENLWGYGMYVDNAVSSDNQLDIGSAIIGQCQVVIENISESYNQYDFDKAKVIPYVGLDIDGAGTIDRVKLGEFYVFNARHNVSCITLTCYDNMAKFDKPIAFSSLTYPATLNEIVADACSHCGVPLKSNSQLLPHGTYSVENEPENTTTTFRNMIAWVGQITGTNARIDVDGKLEFVWYDADTLNNIISGSGDISNAHIISSTFGAPDVSMNDVIITQINVDEKSKDNDENTVIVRNTRGTLGYTISIENNELVQGGYGDDIAEWLYNDLYGFRFRKASFSCLSDPSIEAGDVAKLSDRKGNVYAIIVGSTKFQVGNMQTIVSPASEPEATAVQRSSQSVRNYVGALRELAQERSARLEGDAQVVRMIEADYVSTTYLEANYINADTVDANIIAASNILAGRIDAQAARIDTIETTDLNAIRANISQLDAASANIQSLLSGNVGTGALQTITLNTQNATIATQLAQNILASNATVANLVAGNINTDNVTISSADGAMQISGSVQQFKDNDGNVRIQIGKDAHNVYSFAIYDANGNALWYNDGITANGIPNNTIVNNMVASVGNNYTGITADKLNISSVKGAIEQGGFSSSLIYFDDQHQSLNQVYTQMTSDIYDASDIAQQAKNSADTTFRQLNQIKDVISEIDTLEGMVLMLTNEAHVVHTYNDGSGGDYSGAVTSVIVILGETDVTSQAIISYTESASVTGIWDSTNKTYRVTNLSDMNGYVDFEATYGSRNRYLTSRSGLYYTTRSGKRLKLRSGAAHLGKRFSISKSPDGRVGTSYSVMSSVLSITRDAENVLHPSGITFTAITNSGTQTQSYNGYFKIEESTNGSTYTQKYISQTAESSKYYTPSTANLRQIRCTLMDENDNVLDIASIAVIADADEMQADIAQAKQSIQSITTRVGNVETGIEGLSVSLAQTNLELQGVSDGILVFQTPYQWTQNGTVATFSAVVYRNGVDSTNDFDASQFDWFIKNESGESKIATGKTCSVNKSSLGFGSTVLARFTTT